MNQILQGLAWRPGGINDASIEGVYRQAGIRRAVHRNHLRGLLVRWLRYVLNITRVRVRLTEVNAYKIMWIWQVPEILGM